MSKTEAPVSGTKVVTGKDTRFSYVNVFEPKSINGSTPKYSVSLIIPKSDTETVRKINAAIRAAYKDGEAKLRGNGRSVPALENILYADDAAAESIKSFKNGKLTLGVDDIGIDKAQLLTGAGVDDNGVLVSTSEDLPPYVAVGFRAQKSNGKYRYFWLYKVQFGIPSVSLQTKGDSISFQTPSIEGTIVRRNKPLGNDKHPWKAEVTEGDAGVSDSTITNWFKTVYEPTYAGD